MRHNGFISSAFVIAWLAATPALAHVKVVSSTPADKSAVPSPATISIRFSNPLMPAHSEIRITDAQGGGIAVTLTPPTDTSEIIVTPAKPLAPGTYRATWSAAGQSDGHHMSGNISFTVK